MGAEPRPTAGQSPNTKRMPASANPTNASARSLRNVNRRTPARVRSANSAIANCSPSPQPRMRGLTARRRSFDSAKAIASSTKIPTTPIIRPPAVGERNRARRRLIAPSSARTPDEAALEPALARKAEQRQTDERGQQPLTRDAGDRHDQAQRDQHGAAQVLGDHQQHVQDRAGGGSPTWVSPSPLKRSGGQQTTMATTTTKLRTAAPTEIASPHQSPPRRKSAMTTTAGGEGSLIGRGHFFTPTPGRASAEGRNSFC